MSKIVIFKCDVCGKETSNKRIDIQVIFTTEQDEGRAVDPYFDYLPLDLCDEHLVEALKGNYIFAFGAMGHNKYEFRNKSK